MPTVMKDTSTNPPVDVQPVTVRMIQSHIGAALTGDDDAVITGVNGFEVAQPGELTFAENEKHLARVRQCRASAVIVPRTFPAVEQHTLLRADNPRLAFLLEMVKQLHGPKSSGRRPAKQKQ